VIPSKPLDRTTAEFIQDKILEGYVMIYGDPTCLTPLLQPLLETFQKDDNERDPVYLIIRKPTQIIVVSKSLAKKVIPAMEDNIIMIFIILKHITTIGVTPVTTCFSMLIPEDLYETKTNTTQKIIMEILLETETKAITKIMEDIKKYEKERGLEP